METEGALWLGLRDRVEHDCDAVREPDKEREGAVWEWVTVKVLRVQVSEVVGLPVGLREREREGEGVGVRRALRDGEREGGLAVGDSVQDGLAERPCEREGVREEVWLGGEQETEWVTVGLGVQEGLGV